MTELAEIANDMISVLETQGEGDEQVVIIIRSGNRTLSQMHGFLAADDPMHAVSFLIGSAMAIARANDKQVVVCRLGTG